MTDHRKHKRINMAIKDKKTKKTKELYREHCQTSQNTEEKKLINELLRRLSIVEGKIEKMSIKDKKIVQYITK